MPKRATIAVLLVLAAMGLVRTAAAQGPALTLKAGGFFPSDDIFREVYGSGLVFGLDVTVPLTGILDLWAGADFLGQSGLLPVSEEATNVRIVPLFAGLRARFDGRKVRPYLGVAAAYFLFHEENPIGSVTESALGLITQAGLLARLGGAVWLDLFAGYRACTVSSGGEDPLEANLGGLSAGLGLAYRF
jgi:hypothetical protein